MLRLSFVLAFAVGLLPAGQATTAGCIIDTRPAVRTGVNACGPATDSRELLQNPGFESGSMDPWQTTNWTVTSNYPHGGTYCACDVGDYSITQWVDTTPGSEIQSITFWARQPDAPAAQACHLLYSDGSYDGPVLFPTATWQKFDVTASLNRGKSLVGLRIWGYSGGGPGPDSSYIDDVSILVPAVHDVAVTEISCPRDTILLDSAYTPVCLVANLGDVTEQVRTVIAIGHAGGSSYYADTTEADVDPGDTVSASFASFQPDSAVQHRVSIWTTLANDTNRLNDTLQQFFWVTGVEAVASPRSGVGTERPGATVMTAASLRALMSDRESVVRDVSGRLATEPRPGVYFVHAAESVRKVVVTR